MSLQTRVSRFIMNILILLSCSLHSRGPHDDCKPTGATSAPHSTCPDFGKTSDEDYMTVANLLVPASDLPFSGTTAWTRAGEVLNWRSSPPHLQLQRRYGQFLCEHLIMPLVSSKTFFLGFTRESYRIISDKQANNVNISVKQTNQQCQFQCQY